MIYYIKKINIFCFIKVFLGCLLLFELSCSSSGDIQDTSYYKNPESILNEISKRGANTVVFELYSDPTIWNYILKSIATGKATWLKTAVALHSGSDAGSSEMLTLALGEALETSPENVFRITLSEFDLNSICKGVDVDDNRYNSYEIVTKVLDRRKKRIIGIDDPNLKETSNKCILLIDESRKNLVEYYNGPGDETEP